MRKQPLYLSLGSNLGDRKANIDMALERLNALFGGRYSRLSPIIETKALGFDGNDFLNCIVVYESARKPENILKACKEIERSMGRTDAPEYDSEGGRIYHNRTMDIDILIYGNIRVHTEKLTIPHPQVETRPFIKELLLLL